MRPSYVAVLFPVVDDQDAGRTVFIHCSWEAPVCRRDTRMPSANREKVAPRDASKHLLCERFWPRQVLCEMRSFLPISDFGGVDQHRQYLRFQPGSRTRRKTSKPLMSGISRSRITASGVASCNEASASLPFLASSVSQARADRAIRAQCSGKPRCHPQSGVVGSRLCEVRRRSSAQQMLAAPAAWAETGSRRWPGHVRCHRTRWSR